MGKLIAVILALLAPLCCAPQARAIPAFARHYQTDCSSCHTVIPQRNAFGDAFAKNGFYWPGAPIGKERIQTGFSGEREAELATHRMLWPATVPDLAPISFVVEHDAVYNQDGNGRLDADADTDFTAFTAGSWRGRVAWWADYNVTPDRELGEGYLQLRAPFSLPLNLKGGQFQPRLSIWKSNDTATVSAYGYNGMTVGDNPFAIGQDQAALEVNAVLGSRIFAATGVTFPHQARRGGTDWYGHVSARLGGTDFLGGEPRLDLDRESLLDLLSVTLGAFGYLGSSREGTDDFYRTGAEMEAVYRGFTARLNAVLGGDDRPREGAGAEHSLFFMAQGEYLFPGQVLAGFRYEYEDLESEGVTRRYIPSLTLAPWENLRLALEYLHEARPSAVGREGTFRVSFAF